jgi:hypothetical protein
MSTVNAAKPARLRPAPHHHRRCRKQVAVPVRRHLNRSVLLPFQVQRSIMSRGASNLIAFPYRWPLSCGVRPLRSPDEIPKHLQLPASIAGALAVQWDVAVSHVVPLPHSSSRSTKRSGYPRCW